MIGERFGKWLVLHQAEGDGKTGHKRYVCRCDCGTERTVYKTHLISGRSLGCKECATVTHGMTRTKTYLSWQAMRERCSNKKHIHFDRYGGRGITVCDRWNSFENFLADMGSRPAGMSIERADNDAGYCKENCKWAGKKEQANNTSGNRTVTYNGQVFTVAQLSEHLGIGYQTLYSRVRKGVRLDSPVR